MRMQVKLEIGHKAACRTEPTAQGFTHDWTVFVRGSEGKDVSHFVEKVTFYLHESFPRPKRIVKEPPYKVDESGYGSFELKIEVCFKTKDEPRRVNFTYDLFLPLSGYPPVSSVRTEALTFTHPADDFMKKLIKGGGIPISANATSNGINNGHASGRGEDRNEMTQKPSSNSNGVTENEKQMKKAKVSKPKASSAVVGMKRPSPLHEQNTTDGIPRKKKKSQDGGNVAGKTKHSHSDSNSSYLETTQSLTTEIKDLKLKFKALPPKEGADKAEKRKDSDGQKSKNSHGSKNKEGKSQKAEGDHKKPSSESTERSNKIKKKSGERTEKSRRSAEKKEKSGKTKKDRIEKMTIRRKSNDSWANTEGSDLMSNVLAKNKNIGKFLSQLSTDDEEKVDISTPFKPDIPPTLAKYPKEKANHLLNSKSDCLPHSSGKSSHSDKSNAFRSFQPFTKNGPKEASQHKEKNAIKSAHVNTIKNQEKLLLDGEYARQHEESTQDSLLDSEKSQPSHSINPNTLENGRELKTRSDGEVSNEELYDLHEQISNCEDSEFLQKIVDVIETTGLYTVAEKTFEFDLCCLEKSTLIKLQKCLSKR